MNEFDNEDFKLGKAIGKSRLTMPNARFENQVIARMQHQIQRRNNYKYIRYSMLCFALFVVTGIAGSYFLPGYLAKLSGFSAEDLKLGLSAVLIFCMVVGIDYFIKYFKVKSLQRQ